MLAFDGCMAFKMNQRIFMVIDKLSLQPEVDFIGLKAPFPRNFSAGNQPFGCKFVNIPGIPFQVCSKFINIHRFVAHSFKFGWLFALVFVGKNAWQFEALATFK